MVFSSLTFLFIFLPSVIFLYYTVFRKSIVAQNGLLLISSLLFYAWGEPRFAIVMIFSIFVNYVCGLLISKYADKKKLFLIIDIIFNLALLYVFKYLNFTIYNINQLFGNVVPQTSIVLPIGISFFTFQAMSYVIDVYRGDVKVQNNPFYVALYISFFPQLIAGPIVRYTDIEERINERHVTSDTLYEGIRLFIIGLSKKVLIANNLALITDGAFSGSEGGTLPSAALAWLGAICYALQIYFDFDGYSEMAIGLGKMFGFDFPRNFIYPYRAATISEFWRYNHISLSTWFRDYVYIPLGGSRVNKRRWMLNVMTVWTLTGVWHGANWIFLLWGLCYGIILIIEKEFIFKMNYGRLFRIFYRGCTLVMLFILNGVFFRDLGVSATKNVLLSMFGGADKLIDNLAIQYICEYKVILIIGIIYAFAGFQQLAKLVRSSDKGTMVLDIATPTIYFFLLLASISYLVIGAYNPFIYFNF